MTQRQVAARNRAEHDEQSTTTDGDAEVEDDRLVGRLHICSHVLDFVHQQTRGVMRGGAWALVRAGESLGERQVEAVVVGASVPRVEVAGVDRLVSPEFEPKNRPATPIDQPQTTGRYLSVPGV